MLSVSYAECHIQALYEDCHYAVCLYAEYRGARYWLKPESCTLKPFSIVALNKLQYYKIVYLHC
jgi:hypothetical protein